MLNRREFIKGMGAFGVLLMLPFEVLASLFPKEEQLEEKRWVTTWEKEPVEDFREDGEIGNCWVCPQDRLLTKEQEEAYKTHVREHGMPWKGVPYEWNDYVYFKWIDEGDHSVMWAPRFQKPHRAHKVTMRKGDAFVQHVDINR